MFKTCIFDAFLFNPTCAKGLVHKWASCRSKRVNDHNRFYANFRDFRGAQVSRLTVHVLKPNASPILFTYPFVVVAEQEIILNHALIMDLLLALIIRALPLFRMCAH